MEWRPEKRFDTDRKDQIKQYHETATIIKAISKLPCWTKEQARTKLERSKRKKRPKRSFRKV